MNMDCKVEIVNQYIVKSIIFEESNQLYSTWHLKNRSTYMLLLFNLPKNTINYKILGGGITN